MKYLSNEQHYLDLYDLHTIEECLRIEKQSAKNSESLQKIKAPIKEKLRAYFIVNNLLIYHTTGERYKRKEKTIKKWMENDQLRDEKIENTSPPSEIFCNYCDEPMEAIEKVLHDIEVEKLRVLFFFNCQKCNKRRAIFDNGEEFNHVELCPKCKSEIKTKRSRKGKVLVSTYTCPSCKYEDKKIWDFDKTKEEERRKKEADRKLLEKYRARYCLSDEEGQKYVSEVERLKILMATIKEQEKKQKDPVYKKVRKLKKIQALQLEKLLKKVLEKEKYTNLQFDKPEISKFVIIPFTVQEANSKREEYDSRNNLKKLIKRSLEKTNWRLMNNEINYRLGYLRGRLKGYENEDEIASLIKTSKT